MCLLEALYSVDGTGHGKRSGDGMARLPSPHSGAEFPELKNSKFGTSLLVQWLRLHTPNVGSLGSIPGQGTRPHMLQLRPGTAK